MVMMASKMQEQECGDGTSLVLALAGELLTQAEILIKMGLHPSQILLGYEAASTKVVELLENVQALKLQDIRDQVEVSKCLTACISSKLHDYAPHFTQLVAKACIQCTPKDPSNFDTQSVRICKIQGGNPLDSLVMQGLIVSRSSECQINRCDKPKIAIYGCALDTQVTDEKTTVLLTNAEDLKKYTRGEEDHCEEVVKAIADSGCTAIILGGSISEIMKHYVEKYKIMIVKVLSKFELRRLAKALSARIITKLGAPTAEEFGCCDSIVVEEVGSQKITRFYNNSENCNYSTVILRGNTKNTLDDIERAIDDGVNVFSQMARDGTFCPGAGATEIVLAAQLEEFASKIKGLDQYSYNNFARAFEVIPRILADNAGLNSNEIISSMYALNGKDKGFFGLDIEVSYPHFTRVSPV